jgi:putative membrane protein
MTAWERLAGAWSWQPSVVVGCALLAGGYLGLAGGRAGGRASWFLGGIAVLAFALLSPLDVLGDRYLFSAHMLQHMLLVLVVPPMLLLGLPEAWVRLLLAHPLLGRAERVARHPVLAWAIGMGTVGAWHLPALYNLALAELPVHVFQHLTFLASSVVFWWPVCAPVAGSRMSAPGALGYLLAAALASSGLGIVLTVVPPGWYPAYLHPADPLGILPMIRDGWGLSAEADQQLGGLLMWVPGGLVYLVAILATLGRWYRENERAATYDPAAGVSGGELHGA